MIVYPLTIIRADGAELEINDNVEYATDAPLHDMSDREAKVSVGYADGGRFIDSVPSPRQFTALITILAGRNTRPIRNALHNAARDELIRFMPEGEEITLRTTYIGAATTYDLKCFVLNMRWIKDTSQYEATLLALDPRLFSTTDTGFVYTLPNAGTDTRTFNLAVAGNTSTGPLVAITPTAPKASRWNYRRVYTVSNPRNVALFAEPACIMIDLAALIAAGKLRADVGDLRVIANGVMMDRWPSVAGGRVWVELDFAPAATVDVEVIYGYAAAPAWTNAKLGPIFNQGSSTNAQRRYIGVFKDGPGWQGTRSKQWTQHLATSQGMRAIDRHLPLPWVQIDASAVNAAGGEVPASAQVQGYGGLALHEPLWITSVLFRGQWQLDPRLIKLALRARTTEGANEDYWAGEQAITSVAYTAGVATVTTAAAHNLSSGNLVVLEGVDMVNNTHEPYVNAQHSITVTGASTFTFIDGFPPGLPNTTGTGGALFRNTRATLAPFPDAGVGMTTVTFPAEREAIVFALRSQSVHNEAAGAIGGVDTVYVNISTPLTVSGGLEETIYMLDFTITNNTTGEIVHLLGSITKPGGVWNTVLLDLRDMTVFMGVANFYYALSTNSPIRARWLRLKPGNNSITIRDEGVSAGGLSVQITWNSRRV